MRERNLKKYEEQLNLRGGTHAENCVGCSQSRRLELLKALGFHREPGKLFPRRLQGPKRAESDIRRGRLGVSEDNR